MPPIAKPKENRITKLAKAVKARSPLPSFINDAILPTDVPTDVAGLLPMGTEIEAGASMLSPLISIYKDKAAREAATQDFMRSVFDFTEKNALPDRAKLAWNSAADYFASRYPRIAAHVRQNRALEPYEYKGMQAGASMSSPPGRVRDPLTLSLHTGGVDEITKDPSEAFDFMFHEMTHAAQSLGNKDADELYQLSAALTPYKNIPAEISARTGGAKGKFALKAAGGTKEADLNRKFIATYAHPESQMRGFRSRLTADLENSLKYGDPSELRRSLAIYGNQPAPSTPTQLRRLADQGFLAPEGTEQRLAATRITKIMNKRNNKPMAPTREQLTQMSPFAELALKLNLK